MRHVNLYRILRAEPSVCSNVPRAIANASISNFIPDSRKPCPPIQAPRATIALSWITGQTQERARFFSTHRVPGRTVTNATLRDNWAAARPGEVTKNARFNTAISYKYSTSTKPPTSQSVSGKEKSTFNLDTKPDTAPRPEPRPEPRREPNEALPSQHVLNRSTLASSFNSKMDRLLNALASLSQRVNIYTGTDYSGISSLRNEITNQEQHVSSLHDAVATAKEAHAAAVASQAASNKEVVRLLERKNSWSDTDLERYMGLIRSEHENEQAVQSAKEAITQAERDLEETRSELERTERKQYHEEQIWSDTIRRNSTWVTFGLMGFNIVLLLASLVIIEPWRRRRLVKEIRSTLADQAHTTAAATGSPSTMVSLGNNTEAAADAAPSSAQLVEEQQSAAELAIVPPPTASPSMAQLKNQSTARPFTLFGDTWTGTLALWRLHWADLFSERIIALRRIDLTVAALEGVAAGAAFMGFIFVFLRPR